MADHFLERDDLGAEVTEDPRDSLYSNPAIQTRSVDNEPGPQRRSAAILAPGRVAKNRYSSSFNANERLSKLAVRTVAQTPSTVVVF